MAYIEGRGALPDIINEGVDWAARRREIIGILEVNEYGRMPPAPAMTGAEIIASKPDFAGKAKNDTARISFETPGGEFSFPLTVITPVSKARAPMFLMLSFNPGAQDAYCPAEEILDAGYGIARIYYKDIVNDNLNGDFSDGLGRLYVRGARASAEWGKIGMWAYAASRAMDYLITRPDVDEARVALTGHSRLGKTALWCGALDERFGAVIANDSGAGGAALYRGKTGEHISDFVRSGMWDWFAEGIKAHADGEADMPFDQHMLLALIAPRPLLIGTAREDSWADPEAERDACLLASKAYEALGLKGLIAPGGALKAGDEYQQGNIAFHTRAGAHFLSRDDWHAFIRFLNARGWA